MTFVRSSIGNTCFIDRENALDTLAFDVGESPIVVVYEELCRPMACIVKGCLLSFYFLSFFSRLSLSSFMSLGKSASWINVRQGRKWE